MGRKEAANGYEKAETNFGGGFAGHDTLGRRVGAKGQ